MRFSLKKYVRTIAANSQTDIDVYGDKAWARSVPSGCQIKFDDGEAIDFYTGVRFGVNSWIFDALGSFFPSVAAKLSPNGFKKISIINNNATAVTVEVAAGFGDIADDSIRGELYVNENVTLGFCTNVSGALGEAKGIDGVNNMRWVTIINTGAVDITVLVDNGGDITLAPNDSVKLPRKSTNAPYWIKSTVGAWSAIYIKEI